MVQIEQRQLSDTAQDRADARMHRLSSGPKQQDRSAVTPQPPAPPELSGHIAPFAQLPCNAARAWRRGTLTAPAHTAAQTRTPPVAAADRAGSQGSPRYPAHGTGHAPSKPAGPVYTGEG